MKAKTLSVWALRLVLSLGVLLAGCQGRLPAVRTTSLYLNKLWNTLKYHLHIVGSKYSNLATSFTNLGRN
jgi:hypothetical protein